MNSGALLAALALLLASPARAFLGFGATPDAERVPLLFVPEASALDFDALQELLEDHPDAGLTVALAPEEIPETASAWLAELVKNGRVELALRLEGDPIIPLVDGYRKRDIPERVALARIRYKQLFGRYPDGFVPGGGALTKTSAAHFERQKFRWAAVGSTELETPWRGKAELVFVPFRLWASSESAGGGEPSASQALVLSEPDGSAAPGQGLALLKRAFAEGRADRWISVSAALAHMAPDSIGPELWPVWQGELASWSAHPVQKRAWRLYALAAKGLDRYQNSGSAELTTLKRATAALYRAQSSAFFRVAKLRRPRVDKEFRKQLAAVFERAGKAPPKLLRSPVYEGLGGGEPEAEEEDEPGSSAGAEDADAAGRVNSGSEGERLFFENPKESAASLPKLLPTLAPGATAQDLWTPRGLKAAWNAEAVIFTISMRRMVNLAGAPNGFDSLMADLYLDLNHLAGRGSTQLLPGRRASAAAKDAWEYAITVTGWSAGLYRSLPDQPPALVEPLKLSASPAAGDIRITVPRKLLRGNPTAWGYLLLTLASDQELGARTPPLPLPGENGSPLLGLLGPLAEQARLAQGPSSSGRLSAVRLEETGDRPPR